MKKTIRLTESDLIRLVKRVLKEQLLGTAGNLVTISRVPKVNSPKGTRLPTPEIEGGEAVPSCEAELLGDIIDQCEINSSYTSIPSSEYYTKELYNAMTGLSWNKDNLYNVLQKIPDGNTFCRVAKNFKNSVKKFDKDNKSGLFSWISDEFNIDYKKIVGILKNKGLYSSRDYCDPNWQNMV